MLEELLNSVRDTIGNMELPDNYAVNYWKLAARRVFYINDEINEDILEIQKAILEINFEDIGTPVEQRKPIVLMINTPGGYLQETFSLVDMITLSKTPVYTVNIGAAHSGGFILLIAGHKRFALEHSTALCHSGSSGNAGTYEQMEAAQNLYRKQIGQMKDYILSHTSIDDKLYKKRRSSEWYMDAQEQLSCGAVDKIVGDLNELFNGALC